MSPSKESFETFLKTQLNEEQQKAVTQSHGSILVVAGAGSGKTRVITARIAHLIINEQVDPLSIVAVTFTNKAANEMKKRIVSFLARENRMAQIPFIGTFHAYCLRLLKQHARYLKYPFFSILDEDDQHKLITNIIKRNNLQKQVTAKQVAYQISFIKNRSINPKHEIIATQPKLLQDIYTAYEQEKRESKSLDFDDLLLHSVKLLHSKKEVKQDLQKQIRHILVDEYQDTNVTQHELLKQLALCTKKQLSVDSLCVVGDEDQSIYSWRGATVANILTFQHDFPKTKVITIEQNYRSVQPILDVANNVIKHNQHRNPKKLWSARNGNNRVCTLLCLSEYQEAEAIAQSINLLTGSKQRNVIALLYRAHFQSRAIEEALIRHSIPYRIIGGIQFYERKEIKDLLAYLRLIVNPFDRTAFFRIINCPPRGLGQSFEELFYTLWRAEPFLSFNEIAIKLIKEGNITATKKTSLIQFLQIFEDYTHKTQAPIALEHILQTTNYIEYLNQTCEKEEAESRIENIKELMHAFTYFEAQGITTLEHLLDEISLMQEKMHGNQEQEQSVVLMTLHAAKGLEFNTVIIVGLDEGILPSSRSFEHEESIEEERRLLYVGITRAKERLMLMHARYRYTYGQMVEQCHSRFLNEIPQHLQQQQDISYWNNDQISHFFSLWLGTKIRKESSLITFGTAAPSKQKNYSKSVTHRWKINQPVNHPQFGIGTIKKIEEKSNNKIYLTVDFKMGTKKIAEQFLKQI
jgi:DNA helicase-2/ATP-dependent DNA helicase PcrA